MYEALQIGPFTFWTHLLFLLLGFWLSVEFFLRLAQSAGLSLHHFRAVWPWYSAAFILGGRVFTVIENYRLYTKNWLRLLVLWDGNFSFLGAAIGIACVIYVGMRQSRATFLQWLDVLLPAATFGLFFDWLGKFAAGQSYGSPTDLFWGITYDSQSVPYTVPVHPVQLYYAIFFLLLTFILLVVRKHSKRSGAETLCGIIAASVGTMLLELFRGDPSTPVFATGLDILLLILLFLSLGIVAVFESKLAPKLMLGYEVAMTILVGSYFVLRSSLEFATYQLRFSQFLAVLALLTVVVYVIVHRQRYPNL